MHFCPTLHFAIVARLGIRIRTRIDNIALDLKVIIPLLFIIDKTIIYIRIPLRICKINGAQELINFVLK